MTDSRVAIREATAADAEPIARLICDLGYPTAADRMRERLAAILRDDDYDTLVACSAGEVVGFVGTRVGILYEADDRAGQIVVLAVAESHRRRGIGRVLLEAGEARLIARGARAFVLTSAIHRGEAHAFYERLGYAFTGRRYRKTTPDLTARR